MTDYLVRFAIRRSTNEIRCRSIKHISTNTISVLDGSPLSTTPPPPTPAAICATVQYSICKRGFLTASRRAVASALHVADTGTVLFVLEQLVGLSAPTLVSKLPCSTTFNKTSKNQTTHAINDQNRGRTASVFIGHTLYTVQLYSIECYLLGRPQILRELPQAPSNQPRNARSRT